MSMSDPLADLLTRIRNGQSARLATIASPNSNLRAGVLDALKREGYIANYSKVANDNGFDELKIELKYVSGQPVIKEITRVSKPGKRVYSSIADLPKYYNGLGIAILSTPKGIMSDYEARQSNLGGEILCTVF